MWGRVEGGKSVGTKEGERGESMRDWEGQVGGRREGAIMKLVRNLALGKFPGIFKDYPSKESKQ